MADKYKQKAFEIIEKFKEKYLNPNTRSGYSNHFMMSLNWHENDTWIEKSWWVDAAKKFLKDGHYQISSFEVLLKAGHDEYLPEAIQHVENVYQKHGDLPDDYYYYDLLCLLPDSHFIKQEILNYKQMEFQDDDGMLLKRALIESRNNFYLDLVNKEINSILSNQEIDQDDVEYIVMPMLSAFGEFSVNYVSDENILKAKSSVLDILRKDECSVKENWRIDNKSQTLWVRDKIAVWAHHLDWLDVLDMLKQESWYWEDLFAERDDFDMDYEYTNLLAWSFHKPENPVYMQRLHNLLEQGCMEAAIAYTRLMQ